MIFKDVETSNWTWDHVGRGLLLAPVLLAPAGLELREPRGAQGDDPAWWTSGSTWAWTGCGWTRCPTSMSRRAPTARTCPQTHAFLKKLRAHVDEKYQDRMLLAEANQWPEDAVAYFGQGRGDECHMAYHFPLMPRLFMAVRMEDRTPIVDILEQTPAIPETSQWALFLRNHDELTLEMVTDEERDYMYRMYAHVAAGAAQPGHPAAAGPAAGQRPQTH